MIYLILSAATAILKSLIYVAFDKEFTSRYSLKFKMTSTDYIQGINKMKKPATKVMAPPGGKTNINIFGGEQPPEEHTVNKGQALRNQSSIFSSAEEPVSTHKTHEKSTISEPSVQCGANTSKDIPSNTQPEESASKGRPSTKVMAPPGGKTSINLFG